MKNASKVEEKQFLKFLNIFENFENFPKCLNASWRDASGRVWMYPYKKFCSCWWGSTRVAAEADIAAETAIAAEGPAAAAMTAELQKSFNSR